jgi:peptide/nickel transport system permease protein
MLVLLPGIVLTITVLAINLVGDGLRDRLDPKLRAAFK